MEELIEAICRVHQLKLLNHETVHGGDINKAYKLEAVNSNFFIKINDASLYPGMLLAEAKGLDILRSTKTFRIPEVIATGQIDSSQYLLLEWIPQGKPQQGFWENFGERLAHLHGQSRKSFGLDFDNYIGSLPQSNVEAESFATFYANQRIMPLVEKLYSKGDFNKQHVNQFENFCHVLPNLVPDEPPALLHGDLWAGNYMVGVKGEPVLIDPAPYYGHREMDIAMTQLFGGFDKKMLNIYNEAFPLEKDWKARIGLFQLYPILVHAVLFGGHYTGSAVSILHSYL